MYESTTKALVSRLESRPGLTVPHWAVLVAHKKKKLGLYSKYGNPAEMKKLTCACSAVGMQVQRGKAIFSKNEFEFI
jgi:hypothetical protein